MTDIPDIFCWTKYGTEAGEHPAAILARKESERRANHGVFLWGIGNAIGPSVELLLEHTDQPQVVFTPMLSRPATRDVAPPRVAIWTGGIGLSGSPFDVPAHSVVTSRISPTGRAHYALVCQSNGPLTRTAGRRASFASSHVLNLRSGSRVGASQVTSVVRRIACALGLLPSSYNVTFTVNLAAPYLVRLTEYELAENVETTTAIGIPAPAR